MATTELSPREMQIATLVWRGYKQIQIAAQLGLKRETVKRHMTGAFNKTGMSSMVELAVWMERNHGDCQPAAKSAAIRVQSNSASFHVKTVQTIHGTELQIEVLGQ